LIAVAKSKVLLDHFIHNLLPQRLRGKVFVPYLAQPGNFEVVLLTRQILEKKFPEGVQLITSRWQSILSLVGLSFSRDKKTRYMPNRQDETAIRSCLSTTAQPATEARRRP
jgi:hypothetical protein